MPDEVYTVITFSPVQGFIEKSRKLRDLYGSSFLLSYLADAICNGARDYLGGDPVISPARVNVTLGTPNQIVVRGEFPEAEARKVFLKAWKTIARACQSWVEQQCDEWMRECWERWVRWGLRQNRANGKPAYPWYDDWQRWERHAWEFFWATGASISEARKNLNEIKRARGWTGVNWIGESSTLSGADGVAYPGMSLWTGKRIESQVGTGWNEGVKREETREFYALLNEKIGGDGAIIDPTEELSIPESIKRLITLPEVARSTSIDFRELPKSFRDLSKIESWAGWFQGDGDKAGKYLQNLEEQGIDEAEGLHEFSRIMREWGVQTLNDKFPAGLGRIIYAGGDDFLGVFYRNDRQLAPAECLQWFYGFPREVWPAPDTTVTRGESDLQFISASIGFVWAAGGVPQRDVLQHCKEAERAAKSHGRDRIALRILFNGGNHLQWVCPWRFLERILTGYRDRDGGQNWGHIYSDIATLEARHAFSKEDASIAGNLFTRIYFPDCADIFALENWWNVSEQEWWTRSDRAGILGDLETLLDDKEEEEIKDIRKDLQGWFEGLVRESDRQYLPKINTALNNWIINLAKVGFHLCN
ncbi:MAG: type III-B CRISPR-associated protein Cas10/Cmr2 [Cyanobacteria bacterium P01_E01_bin.42]